MKEFEMQRIRPKIKPVVEEKLLDLLTGTDPANSSTYVVIDSNFSSLLTFFFFLLQ